MVALHSLGSSGCIIDNPVVNPVVEKSLEGRQNSLIYGMEARAGIEPAHTGFANQCITTLLPRQARCVRGEPSAGLGDVNWVKMLLARGDV